MRVLGLDPGAVRLGYGLVERSGDDYNLIASGIAGLAREDDEAFGAYRRRLIEHWINPAHHLPMVSELGNQIPHIVASEKVPAVGSGNFISATQSELVKVAMVAIHVWLTKNSVEWVEIDGSTVKKATFGAASKPPKAGTKKRRKVTKVDMRNAVFKVFPQLRERTWEEDLLPDEIDGIAVALTALGYKAGKP